ncbi:Alpha/Beta hydrolase protein [Mycena latifolia]|nr:Alpha/Beta hydrolase protein [Mycena latifolia]
MSLYQCLSELPLPTAAGFIKDDVVEMTSSIRDNVRDIKRALSTSIFLGSDPASTGPAVDASDIVSSIAAPSGSICFPRRAVLRETAEKRRYVEIWIGNVLEVSEDVSDSHESFYSDEFFSGLSFSPSELALLYVAEAREPTGSGEKFKFTPHIGETLAGKRRPTIFVFRWDASIVPSRLSLALVSPTLDQDHPVLFGQPVFSPLDSGKIYATGYEYTRDGRLLGLKWCYNRPSGIWEIEFPPYTSDENSSVPLRCVCKKLTPADLSCRSPRIHHDKLFWISCASGGPHAGTFSLHVCGLTARELTSKVLVDTVWEPRASDGFPGLYINTNLPVSPFVVLDGQVFLVFESTWASRTTVLLVSASDGTVKDLTPSSDGQLYSWSVLATDGRERVVCSRSAPTVPHEILLGHINALGEVLWRGIYSPYISPGLLSALSILKSSVIDIPDRGRTQTVVIRPSSPESTPPCVQFIHGGPHGATTTAFSPSMAALALEGYTISQPNYSGSTGYGEGSVRALLGNCGTLDVEDCIATARHLVTLGLAVEGKGKQFVIGGSHGGFLTAHLIGQFPDFFTAAVLRNPVISTDPMSSDIPDWYFNEWKIEYPIYSSPKGFPGRPDEARALPPRRTPAESQRIFTTSPIAHVDAVTAHVLLHLGGADLRVTPTHGLEYYHALKGNARNLRLGQGVEMHWFPEDGHLQDGVEVARIVWETSRDWFARYRA